MNKTICTFVVFASLALTSALFGGSYTESLGYLTGGGIWAASETPDGRGVIIRNSDTGEVLYDGFADAWYQGAQGASVDVTVAGNYEVTVFYPDSYPEYGNSCYFYGSSGYAWWWTDSGEIGSVLWGTN